MEEKLFDIVLNFVKNSTEDAKYIFFIALFFLSKKGVLLYKQFKDEFVEIQNNIKSIENKLDKLSSKQSDISSIKRDLKKYIHDHK